MGKSEILLEKIRQLPAKELKKLAGQVTKAATQKEEQERQDKSNLVEDFANSPAGEKLIKELAGFEGQTFTRQLNLNLVLELREAVEWFNLGDLEIHDSDLKILKMNGLEEFGKEKLNKRWFQDSLAEAFFEMIYYDNHLDNHLHPKIKQLNSKFEKLRQEIVKIESKERFNPGSLWHLLLRRASGLEG